VDPFGPLLLVEQHDPHIQTDSTIKLAILATKMCGSTHMALFKIFEW